MIEAENLYKQYAGRHALNGLSLQAGKGSVLGFIGPNGAGKSTAMKILCGIMPPTSGSVSISGINLLQNPREAKEKIGYLPENAPLYAGMSVKAFLNFCGKMRGLSGKMLNAAIESSVEKCRLHDVFREELETLSKGFKRRVCLAQAILHHPENLVLDEPTDGLDPDQKREIRTLIQELKGQTSIIVSTHILEEIDAVCDYVLAIRNGKRVFYGTNRAFRALDPEDGLLIFQFSSFREDPFRDLNSVRILSIINESGVTEIRAKSAYGNPDSAMRDIMRTAADNHLKIIFCNQLSGRLDTVFAGLSGEDEREKSI